MHQRGYITIRLGDCVFCGFCSAACPCEALQLTPEGDLLYEKTRCTQCALCVPACPVCAIQLADPSSESALGT
ncbi:MAG TPA: 4Fe-4S binding protein [Thermotogota bacterium]|nr:4Fe-4S binding protein [Thermotogota bacterium]HRW92620.1 4Fe-4S binding protein [Thermotogota bacterium]